MAARVVIGVLEQKIRWILGHCCSRPISMMAVWPIWTGRVLKSMTSRLDRVCTPSRVVRLFLLVAKFLSLLRGASGVREAMLF
jgi:hypothetical protein